MCDSTNENYKSTWENQDFYLKCPGIIFELISPTSLDTLGLYKDRAII